MKNEIRGSMKLIINTVSLFSFYEAYQVTKSRGVSKSYQRGMHVGKLPDFLFPFLGNELNEKMIWRWWWMKCDAIPFW